MTPIEFEIFKEIRDLLKEILKKMETGWVD